MKRFGGFVVLLCAALQGWALGLSWPADGGIVGESNQLATDAFRLLTGSLVVVCS